MPCLELTTNARIADKPNLMRAISACVCAELNKSETYMMVILHDDTPMFFSGNIEPAAHLSLRAIGLKTEFIKTLAQVLTDLVEEQLRIERQRIYIVFQDAEMNKWAWDGQTFS